MNNIRNANREEAWSNPWAIIAARGRSSQAPQSPSPTPRSVPHTLQGARRIMDVGHHRPRRTRRSPCEIWHLRVPFAGITLVDRAADRPVTHAILAIACAFGVFHHAKDIATEDLLNILLAVTPDRAAPA